jgi:hypothetical protein
LLQYNRDNNKALEVASWLGLEPVGWIFTYNDNRKDEEDSLPVHAQDVHTGAMLQIEKMKEAARVAAAAGSSKKDKQGTGAACVTLAMDGKTGATEAFQLSDMSVQMVAEDVIDAESSVGRFAPTRHGILVDGKEIKQLDSVLCLVNTAMLSHEGDFAGTQTSSTMNKNGSLTKKARKSVLKALEEKTEEEVLKELCNFHTLVALYNDGLGRADCQHLCELVRKWARGQKKGTVLDDKVKRRLKTLLDIP